MKLCIFASRSRLITIFGHVFWVSSVHNFQSRFLDRGPTLTALENCRFSSLGKWPKIVMKLCIFASRSRLITIFGSTLSRKRRLHGVWGEILNGSAGTKHEAEYTPGRRKEKEKQLEKKGKAFYSQSRTWSSNGGDVMIVKRESWWGFEKDAIICEFLEAQTIKRKGTLDWRSKMTRSQPSCASIGSPASSLLIKGGPKPEIGWHHLTANKLTTLNNADLPGHILFTDSGGKSDRIRTAGDLSQDLLLRSPRKIG